MIFFEILLQTMIIFNSTIAIMFLILYLYMVLDEIRLACRVKPIDLSNWKVYFIKAPKYHFENLSRYLNSQKMLLLMRLIVFYRDIKNKFK